MSKQFPMVTKSWDAKCFNCGGDTLRNHRESGHAYKHGSMVADCAKCVMSTWFDVRGSGPMPSAKDDSPGMGERGELMPEEVERD